MQRQNFNDRHAFAGVARERSSQYRRPACFHFSGFISHSNRRLHSFYVISNLDVPLNIKFYIIQIMRTKRLPGKIAGAHSNRANRAFSERFCR